MYSRFSILLALILAALVAHPAPAQERTAQLTSPDAEDSVLGQRAGLDVIDVPLSTALTQLGYVSGVGFAFSPSLLPDTQVDCRCRNLTIRETLAHLLEGTGLSFTVMGNQVVVEKAPRFEPDKPDLPGLLLPHVRQPQVVLAGTDLRPRAVPFSRTGEVVGRVVDGQSLEPLPATQVRVVELDLGVLTSQDGRFSFSDVPAGTYTVRADRLGYRTADETVEVGAEATAEVTLRMRQQALRLDQVVVTGTGREARTREMGTSVGQIDAAQFQHAPVRNPEDILMGREPGVTVQLRSGQVGAMSHISLRGATSVSATRNQPLIYVDGVRLYSHGLSGAQNARQGVHALQSIPASDIERIEVVRGAAASTLYGSEAAAGVIQIFTKQGSTGDPVWELELSTGLNHLGHIGPDSDPTSMLMNCGDVMTVLDRTTWEPLTMVDPTCPAGGSWLETGTLWNVNASVRGGGEDFNYYVSARYGHEDGVVGYGYQDTGGVRANFGWSVTDNLTFSFNSAYANSEIRWVPDGDRGSGFFSNVIRGPSTHFQDSAECADMANPPDHCLVNYRSLSHQPSHQWTDHFTLGGTARWEPRPDFSHRLTLGYDYIETLGQEIIEFGFHRPARFRGRLINRDQERTTASMDYVGSWRRDAVLDRDIGTETSWGFQVVASERHNYFAQADDFAGPGLYTMTDGASNSVRTDRQERVVNPGFFVQQSLAFQDRLYVTMGARVDGHSAFGRDFGFQVYPKVDASYVISDHDFWPRQHVQTFRLRGAVGEAGRAPGAFDAERMWATLPGPGGQAGFTPDVLGNPDLGPERTREIEFGFEGTTLNDRVAVEANAYLHNTHDALVGVQPVPSQGFLSRQLENIGHIQSRGFEFRVEADVYQSPTLAWSVRSHYARNDSEAVDLGGEIAMSTRLQQVLEGHPVPSYVGPRLLNPNEFAEPVYADEDEFLGPVWPVHNVGMGTTLTLGQRLTFDAQGEFQGGHLMQNNTGRVAAENGTWQPCFDIQRALAAGDQAALSMVTARDRVRCAIDPAVRDPFQWLERGDFFKLRVVSLTYEIPQAWLPQVDRATVTLSGRNLLEITDYSGLSVEANQGSGPNVIHRRDHMQIPPYRTFQLTVRTTF